jgi:hypothetical protein
VRITLLALLTTVFISQIMTGCTTFKSASARGDEAFDTNTITPVAANLGVDANAGVVIAYEFTGLNPQGSARVCRMRVISRETKQSHFIDINSEKTASFAKLTPGRYDISRIGCGLGHVYDVDGLMTDGFKAEAGKASYIGKFILSYEGRSLSEVKKASREESANSLQAALTEVPEDMTLVSGFTLGTIDRSMASDAGSPHGFGIHANGLKNSASELAPLVSKLKACESSDATTDSLRFGRLEYVADYKYGRFVDFKDRKDANSFSQSLKTCVSESLSSFQSREKTSFEISVIY